MDNFDTLVSIIIQAGLHDEPYELKRVLGLGQTPQTLIDHAGFDDLELVIKASTVDKVHFDHGISQSVIQRIPLILQAPKAIYASATHPDSAVVMTYELQNGQPVIMPVHKNKTVGRNRTCNEVTSMLGKGGHDPEIRWKNQGLLLWEP